MKFEQHKDESSLNWGDPIKGSAEGKVCTQYTGFLRMYDNVFHDNKVFGINVDNIQPRNVARDANGYVPNNLYSCSRFKARLRTSALRFQTF